MPPSGAPGEDEGCRSPMLVCGFPYPTGETHRQSRIEKEAEKLGRLFRGWAGGWHWWSKSPSGDFLGGPMVKIPPANAGDRRSIPGLGRFHMLWGN